MISVIVLTYNQEKYLCQTLDGILMQQIDEPIEIIIGDDHSSDATSVIGRNYQTLYPDVVRYFRNTSNLGLVQNFITMLSQCCGKYIALCDGDDYWTDQLKLQREVDVMRKYKRCVLVHTHRDLLADKVYTQQPLERELAEDPIGLFFHPYVCVSTVLFLAKPVFAWLNTYQMLSKQQDWRMQDFPLWLYLGTQGEFRYLPHITAMYRVLSNTLSREQNKEKRYRFDNSVMCIKQYFYPLYYNTVADQSEFYRRYKEMEFHTRKRMLINYGWMARGQVLPLLKLIYYLPLFLYRSVRRKHRKCVVHSC